MSETNDILDCGVCDVPHHCHCPRMKAWCDRCVRIATVRNLVSQAVTPTRDPGAAFLRAVG